MQQGVVVIAWWKKMPKDHGLLLPVFTSYYGNRNIHGDSFLIVNIARKQPSWVTGNICTLHNIVPSYQTLYNWTHSSKDEEAMIAYIKQYYRTTLIMYGEDSPYRHLDILTELTREIRAKYGLTSVALTCYEAPGSFCHRLIYSIYLKMTTGVVIPEFGYDPIQMSYAQTIITDTLTKLIKGVAV